MARTIGIDLGTSNSVVAVMEGGVPVVIQNDEGERKTPSVVAYTPEGERLVGTIAKRQAILYPARTVYSIKRFMGRRFNEVLEERQFVPYNVVASRNGEARIEVDQHALHPTEVTAQVLMKLKRAAEDYLGEPATSAVITVPAYFNDAQRQATKDAGTIAGLEVKRLVNEPTAAAIAYGFDKKESATIAVYDFGGGTFDVSLAISDSVVRVLATNGDTHLGGDNIDDRIVKWLLQEFLDETGIDVSEDKVPLQRLKDAAEKVKIELSTTVKREISLPFLAADAKGPKHLVRELTRAQLEHMIEDLVEATVAPTQACLRDANLTPADIDEVVLVGGSTRIPRVQEVVRDLFGKEPNKSVNPDEVVALGAAIQAGILAGDVRGMILLDVAPLSLGIRTNGELMTKIIERNTTVPIRETRLFTTSADNMDEVEVVVLQGERETAAGNRVLGHFHLKGIPLARRGYPRIEVTFDINADGMIGVSAKDLTTGLQNGLQITGGGGLTQEEVDSMVFDAAAHQDADRHKRRMVEARVAAEALAAQTERFAQIHSWRLGEQAAQLTGALADVRRALDGDEDSDALDRAVASLRRNFEVASSTVAEAQGSAAFQQRATNNAAPSKEQFDVSDGGEQDQEQEPMDEDGEDSVVQPRTRRLASFVAGAATGTARAVANFAVHGVAGKPTKNRPPPSR